MNLRASAQNLESRKNRDLWPGIAGALGASLAPGRAAKPSRSVDRTSEEEAMGVVGLAVTLLGFIVAAGSVGISSSNSVRLIVVLAGIVISLFGIIGLINPAYQKNAAWKK
jgi:hypothetical protein